MATPTLHLLSIASSCRALLTRLDVESYGGIIDLAQQAVGPTYRVTGTPALMNPRTDELHGGRRDDKQRCRDLQRALGDDRVRAIVTLRGGSWVTRLLPHIDFDVLKHRSTPLFFFGFSELTTLVNIVARYPRVRAYYDHDLGHLLPGLGDYRAAYAAQLSDVVDIIEGRPCGRTVTGRLRRGSIASEQRVRVVGGCLSVLRTLCGSRFQRTIDPRGKWLAVEDISDDPHEIDRGLAQLKLAGFFERCAGLLVGSFHLEYDNDDEAEDLTAAVMSLLDFHLPSGRRVPIITQCNFGHRHPAAPLAINYPVSLRRRSARSRTIIVGPARDE